MPYDRQSQPTVAKSFAVRVGQAIRQDIHIRRVSLTAAQIIAMGTVPVAILAAPASNKAYVVRAINCKITRTSTAFTGGGVVSFQYHTTTSSVPHAGTIPASFFTGSAGVAYNTLGPNVGANGLTLAPGEGIDITNATAAFAAGTGTMEVLIEYTVVVF